jgi:formylmethanofuran dehydrogenase subunit E
MGSDGRLYCEDCFFELFFKCTNCGEVFSKDDANEADSGDLFCDECFSDTDDEDWYSL